MLLKSATFLCLVVISRSATIQPRNIPVQVQYEDTKDNKDVEVVAGGVSNSVRNLDAKVQLSPEQLRAIPEQSSEEINKPEQSSDLNSLEDTTTQKPNEKLGEQPSTLKSVPVNLQSSDESQSVIQTIAQDEPKEEETSQSSTQQPEEKKVEQTTVIPTKEEPMKEESKVVETLTEAKPAEKREIFDEPSSELASDKKTESVEASKEVVTVVKNLENEPEPLKLQEPQPQQPQLVQEEKQKEEKQQQKDDIPQTSSESAPALLKELPSESENDKNSIEESIVQDKPAEEKPTPDSSSLSFSSIIQEAKNIIKTGIQQLKETLKTETDAPKPEQWTNLESTVTNYLNEENKQTELKADKPEKQGFIQKIASHFQSLTDEFMKTLDENSNEKQTTAKPEDNPKDQARENVQSEESGTPCGAVTGFLKSGFTNIKLSLDKLIKEPAAPAPAVPIVRTDSTETSDALTTIATASKISADQDQSSAESSSTSPPEPSTEQITTAKIEELSQKLEDPANPGEIPASDNSSSSEESQSNSSESQSSSSESQSASAESQSSTEDNQSQKTTTEYSKEIINETTTSK